MVSGAVQAREAVVPISIGGRDGSPYVFDAVLDTGFTGTLALPAGMIERARTVPLRPIRVTLANGEQYACAAYAVAVHWHGEQLTRRVYAMGDRPLIGMGLLTGSRLVVDVTEGGEVLIEPLSA